MTQETLEKAKQNRKERTEKLNQYNSISWKLDNLTKEKIVWLGICGNSGNGSEIYPTNEEYKSLLRTIRNRLFAEIAELDKEFESL